MVWVSVKVRANAHGKFTMHRLLIVGILLGAFGGVRAVAEGAAPPPLATDAEVTVAIARLNDAARG